MKKAVWRVEGIAFKLNGFFCRLSLKIDAIRKKRIDKRNVDLLLWIQLIVELI